MFMLTSIHKKKKIQLAEFISKNLLLRNSADELFNHINNLKTNKITIDFDKIQSVTRAFTHQYLINKKMSNKNIIDANISPHVKNMFDLIEKTKSASQEVNIY